MSVRAVGKTLGAALKARGRRFIGIGDSNTAGQSGFSSGLGNAIPLYSLGVWQSVQNAGFSGFSSAQIAGKFYTAVAPYKPDVVFIMVGTNDGGDEYKLALPFLVNAARALGCLVFFSTIYPRTGGSAPVVVAKNTWIRNYAASLTDTSIVFVDLSLVFDPSNTGSWAVPADQVGDNLHTSLSGTRKATQAALAAMAPFALVGGASFAGRYSYSTADTNLIVPNGFFDQGSAVAGVAAGWTISGGTPSIVSPSLADGIAGNWQQIVVGPNSYIEVKSSTVTAALTQYRGQRMSLFFNYFASGVEAVTGSNIQASIGNPYSSPYINNDTSNSLFYDEFIVPFYAADLTFKFGLYNPGSSASITVKLGAVFLAPVDSIKPVYNTTASQSISSSYGTSLVALQDEFVEANFNGGVPMTMTLPSISGAYGIRKTFKRTGALNLNYATLQTSGSDKIADNGLATYSCLFSPNDTITLLSGVLGWEVVSETARCFATLTANGTIIIPAGRRIDSIDLINTTTSAAGNISIGTSSGASDVVSGFAVGASALATVPDASLLQRIFSLTADKTLFVSSSAWGTASVNVIVRLGRATV